jgi:putative hydrolase of the HAD superfamily
MVSPAFFLFDLDNTLYPRSCGLFDEVDARINRYLEEYVGIPPAEVDRRRRAYFEAYGTTLNGLMRHHGVDPGDYLEYVHAVDLARYLAPDPRLRGLLRSLPGRLFIFSNASRGHCLRVLRQLGVAECFERVFALEDFAFRPKPTPAIYAEVVAAIGAPPRAGVMVDDLAVNLEPAASLGLAVFHYDPAAVSAPPSSLPTITSLRQLRTQFPFAR